MRDLWQDVGTQNKISSGVLVPRGEKKHAHTALAAELHLQNSGKQTALSVGSLL